MREYRHFGSVAIWAAICFMALTSCGNNNSVTSPNNEIVVNYENSALTIQYIEDNVLIPVTTISDLGYGIVGDTTPFELKSVSKPVDVKTSYDMVSGKRKKCKNKGIKRVYHFVNTNDIELDVEVCAYNDGVAYRYSFPNDSVQLAGEKTTYNIPLGLKRWNQPRNGSYEDFYPMNTDGMGENYWSHWNYPALFEVGEDVFMLITESDIQSGNCGSWLVNFEEKSRYVVRMENGDMKCAPGWQSSWHLAIVGSLEDIVESTLVTDVATPCKLESVEWIEPGLVSWIYWAYNHGSKDYQIVKKYIDFAVEMKLPYVLIDWEWDVMANGGNLEDALAYAKERGVKPLLWYNSSTQWLGAGPLYRLNEKENRRKEFAWLKEHGVKGIKVDFFIDDQAATYQYFIDILEDAADYELLVNFHGATIPRGYQRTYPNMVSVEGVYGAEWYNNLPVLTNKAAAHNATLPFTRNVVGPMDYTPCTFTDSQHPHITTDAHELALLVLFESTLQHLADRPEGYLQQTEQVREFISNLPTVWHDTELLAGYPAEYVVMCRESDDLYYIAGINGLDESKEIEFELPDGIKSYTIFQDVNQGKGFDISSVSKVKDHDIRITCRPRGGFVIVAKK